METLFFFGDQTVEKLPAIQKLVAYSQTSRLIRQFLREACDALQLETDQLLPNERANIRDFDHLLRLAEDNARSDEPNEVIATVLMNVARLGELILYAEEDPIILGSHGNPVHILGFCTGEIPAAIAAVARDTSDLLQLAVEAVHIIFRLARELSRRSLLVDRTPGNWATTLVGISPERVQSILDDFHQAQGIPAVRHVCIGFIAEEWLTLFGPPTTLQRLFAWSAELADVTRVKTDVGGAVHMATMPEIDVDTILGSSPLLDRPVVPGVTIISPYSCQPRTAATLRALIREIVPDVAQKTLQLSRAIDATTQHLGARPMRLVVAGFTSHLPYLHKVLQSKGIAFTVSPYPRLVSSSSNQGREGSGLIAVVGMSGRFPGSGDVNTYWEGLLEGKRYVQEIPTSRFDLEKWYDATGQQKNSTLARTGTFLDQPGRFDHRLFKMSPREALQTDVQHRLFLTTSYEALEMAGYAPDATLSTGRNRIATYFGQTSDDWRELVATQGLDIYYAPGNCRAFAPGRLNHYFRWGGGSYSVDTACASSVTAVSLACSALIARECDMALAGGGSLLLSPAPFSGLSRGGFLSSHGGCQTFHDDADGYVRGEGVGVVVLKRLEDALTDNDNILGVIKGFGRNYSSDATSITHPSATAQQRLYRTVLQRSGTDPASVAYIEMHGTGTQAGDATEMSSVLSTFAGNRTPENPLVVGAVKANIGHGEAAAGVCALIKVLMMLKTRKIPPQPDLPFAINHRFPDLTARNVHIAGPDMMLRRSPVADGKLRIFLNSFDASGGNSCLLLEEAPPKAIKGPDPRTYQVVVFSACTKASLAAIKERYLHYLRRKPATSLADLAYTTAARRMHSPLRSAIVAATLEELMNRLEADLIRPNEAPSSTSAAPIVFVFTGQGSQYAGMGHQLWRDSPTFRNTVEDYQAMATALGLPRFLDLIVRNDIDLATQSPAQVQLAVLAIELALAQMWSVLGLQPAMVLGHSLGEYAALCVAGVLTVSDALYLVGTRATMIANALTAHEYSMLAISQDANAVRVVLREGDYRSCEIACLNAPQMTVVSGPVRELERLQSQLRADGSRCTLLSVPFGFHSRQLDPILDRYETAAQGVTFSAPRIPVVSTFLGFLVKDGATFSPAYLRRQAREPVDFVGALRAVQQAIPAGSNPLYLEIGPDPVCLGLIQSTLGNATDGRRLASLRAGEDNWATLSASLGAAYAAGVAIDWSVYHADFLPALSLLDLPTYAFDEKDFWAPYPDPDQLIATATKSQDSTTTIVPSIPGYPTTTLQRIVQEQVERDRVSVTFESPVSEAHLLSAIRGHAVAEVEICPSSILMDMALSAARYAYLKQHSPVQTLPALSVRNPDLHRALVAAETHRPQTVEVTVEYTVADRRAQITYYCCESHVRQELGTCQVTFETTSQKNEFAQFLLRSRIETLKVGQGHRLRKPVVYRLFENVVRYSEPYRGLDEVFLDADLRDAVARVQLPVSSQPGGHYLYNPFLLDSIAHLAGFLVNSGLRYPADVACLTTGFDVWHLFKPLDEATTYTSYTHLEESPSNDALILGNVYILDGDDLASVITGVRFQKMKKVSLSRVLLATAETRSSPRAQPPDSLAQAQAIGEGPTNLPSAFESFSSSSTHFGLVTPNASGVTSALRGSRVLAIVAREVGCNVSDMEPDTTFAALGLDSLMALTIIAAVHNETGVELPGSFFLSHPTVAEAIQALSPVSHPVSEDPNLFVMGDSMDSIPAASVAEQSWSPGPPSATDPVPLLMTESAPLPTTDPDPALSALCLNPQANAKLKAATTVLLSGSVSSTDPALFLMADGTGAVGMYTLLPSLAGGRRMYGVQSPYVRDPASMGHCPVEDLAAAFVVAIRKIQSAGPYLLGGYAAGAVYAWEVSRQLLQAGETVLGLLLIDMPAPAPVSPAFSGAILTPEQIEEAGLMGPGPARGAGMSASAVRSLQKQHHAAALQMLLRYVPQPLPLSQRPIRSTVLVAQHGLGKGPDRVNNPITAWIDANRNRSPTMGWEDLVGAVERHELDTDHFEMLKYPQINHLGKMVNESVEGFFCTG
ncbi:hypothetical protein VTN77DRAFT_7875 [Rasamsonia byssochlamydoides]|uniref:uncharacterized protein n=1 Tax=Rasamsonia byssochlamydoides TaxID=89139 RepID=UPI0037447560